MTATITPYLAARNGHIVALLREEMAKRQWTIRDLSLALGLIGESTTPYPWLHGTSAPSPAWQIKLAAALDHPVEAFQPRLEGLPDRTASMPTARVPTPPAAKPAPARPMPRPEGALVAKSQREPQLSFTVGTDGLARIKLDVTLPLGEATPLLRMLLDAGLVFGPVEA